MTRVLALAFLALSLAACTSCPAGRSRSGSACNGGRCSTTVAYR